MINSEIQYPEFKLGKSVFSLFLLQFSIGFALGIAVYIFAEIFKILPESFGDNHSLAGIGLIVGSLIFGQWMEKKYPGMLDKKRIKDLARWNTVINFILTILVFSVFIYSDYAAGTPFSFVAIGIALVFILLFMILIYFFTKYCITRGVRSWHGKKKNI